MIKLSVTSVLNTKTGLSRPVPTNFATPLFVVVKHKSQMQIILYSGLVKGIYQSNRRVLYTNNNKQ